MNLFVIRVRDGNGNGNNWFLENYNGLRFEGLMNCYIR